jgi:hypothetical protein
MEPEGSIQCPQEAAGPRSCVIFHNKVGFFWSEEMLALRTTQAGGPPLVGCPRLLIQYIRSCPPYLEAVSSTYRRNTYVLQIFRKYFFQLFLVYDVQIKCKQIPNAVR